MEEEDSKVPVTPPIVSSAPQTEEAAKETKIEPAADAVSLADKATSNIGSVADKATKSEPDMNKVVDNIDSLEKLFTLHTDIKAALQGAARSFQSIANGTGENTISLNKISTKITTLVDRPAVNPADVTAIGENVKTILDRPAVTTAEVAAISADVKTLLTRPAWMPWLRAAIIIAVLGTLIVLVRTCSGTPRGAAAAGLTNNVSGALPASAAPNVSAPTQAAPIPAPAPAPKARRVIIQNVITGKVTTIDPDGSTNNDAVVVSSSTQAQTVIVDNRLSGLSNCFNNLSNVQINFGTIGNNNNKGNAVGNTIVVQPVIVHLPPTQILRGPPPQGAPALPPAQQVPTNAPAPAPQTQVAPIPQTGSVANQVGNAPTSTIAAAKNQMSESSASSGGFSSVATVQMDFVQTTGTIYVRNVNNSYVVPAGSGHTGPQ